MIKIEIEKETRQVTLPNKLNPLGYDGENLQDTLEFSFTDTFVNGQARLELQYENKEKTFITLEKIEETYTIPITKIMTVEGQVYAQLVVTEGTDITQPPIFKSKMFYYFVGQSINAETGDKEPYIEWIDRANAKLNQVDEALETINDKIDKIDTAIEETNNLDIDANKVDKTTTVEITKKDNTKKVVQILDGVSLQFMWQGTSLGIKTDNMQDYVFVDLQGVQGLKGDTGEPFRIKKTYSSVAEMNADFNNMEYGDYVMIASSVEVEDNAKLYTRGESAWIYITDFSGSQGIKGETGLTPIIRIGTVTSGATPSVTISGTAEEPILNFVLPKGDKGDKPIKGVDYFTQSDIDSMVAEVTEDATSEFNQNVTAKTNEFNTNATNKTTDFNTNATAKTTEFNDNTTQKTNEFNTNAQNKTDEFNENKEALQEELDRYKMLENALPKVTGEGTSVTLNDTANAPMGMIPMASELEQETTTGKNLLKTVLPSTTTKDGLTLTQNSDGSFILNGTSTNSGSFNITSTNDKLYFTLAELGFVQGETGKLSGCPVGGNTSVPTTSYKLFMSGGSGASNVNDGGSSGTITANSSNMGGIYYISINYASGITFNNIVFKPMIEKGPTVTDYEPYTGGNPSPNPDYPFDIHTISGDNEIVVGNKNLFDGIYSNATIGGTAGNVFVSENTNGKSAIIKCKPNTTYTIKKYESSNRFKIADYNNYPLNNDVVNVLYGNDNTNQATVTTNSNAKYLIVYISTGTEQATPKMQIEENTSATDYVEHQEQTLPLNLGDLEYCKIGDYEDEFVYNTTDTTLELNKWYLKKNIGKYTMQGTENFGNFLIRTISTRFTYAPSNKVANNSNISHFYCNRGNGVPDQYWNTDALGVCELQNLTNAFIIFSLPADIVTEIDTARNWFINNQTYFYYQFKTPQYILLNETLQTQLNNIQKVLAYQDQTSITQINNDLPFVISASALLDLNTLLNNNE